MTFQEDFDDLQQKCTGIEEVVQNIKNIRIKMFEELSRSQIHIAHAAFTSHSNCRRSIKLFTEDRVSSVLLHSAVFFHTGMFATD